MKTLEQSAVELRAVRMLRALANPARYRLVQELAERKEASASELALTSPLAQSSLFEHLTKLKEAGVVELTGDGHARLYSLDPGALDFLAGVVAGLGRRARAWDEQSVKAGREGTMEIRDATPDDAAVIARIYNEGIEDRVATLETELRSADERRQWLAAHDARHPVLIAVAEDGGGAGWGSLNSFNPRPAYDHVADFSVYVARERRGRGVGDLLLSALESRARAIGYHKLVLAALPFNAAGMRLYERHGFRTVGVYREQGMLDGRWVDVTVMDKILD